MWPQQAPLLRKEHLLPCNSLLPLHSTGHIHRAPAVCCALPVSSRTQSLMKLFSAAFTPITSSSRADITDIHYPSPTVASTVGHAPPVPCRFSSHLQDEVRAFLGVFHSALLTDIFLTLSIISLTHWWVNTPAVNHWFFTTHRTFILIIQLYCLGGLYKHLGQHQAQHSEHGTFLIHLLPMVSCLPNCPCVPSTNRYILSDGDTPPNKMHVLSTRGSEMSGAPGNMDGELWTVWWWPRQRNR